MLDNIPTVIPIVAIPIIRGLAGWMENSLRDGTTTWPEFGELGMTVLRMGMIGLGTYWAFDVTGIEAAGVAVLADFGIKLVRKFITVKKK